MADTNKFVQMQKTTLYGSGVSSSDTSIVLSNLVLPDGETLITMTDFGSIGFGTIEPGTAREEQISFTGITQNGDDTATLTGVTRGLKFVSPYTETSANKFAHAGGSTFIVTNTAGFYDQLLAKGNDETITGKYSFDTIPESSDTPLADTDLATKKYVDDNVNGGAVSINRIIVTGTAGEQVLTGQLLYLKVSDSKWWKCDADTAATLDNIKLGLAQGNGDADGAISGGVLLSGLHTTTGLTANSLYYASNTAGGISATTGTNTKVIGQAISTTQLIFDPVFYTQSTNQPTTFITTSAGAGDAGKAPKLNSAGLLDVSFMPANPIVRTYLNAANPATWTKPTGLKYVIVEVQAGGGGSGGVTGSNDCAGGGGSGGYSKKIISANSLGSTETVTIGAGGTGGSPANGTGGTGGTSSFGSHCSASGGVGGTGTSNGSGGAGGTATGGDINLSGFYGGDGRGGGSFLVSGAGADSLFGSGGRMGYITDTVGNVGSQGGQGYGSGASGGISDTAADIAGSAGAPGIVIVTEYYN